MKSHEVPEGIQALGRVSLLTVPVSVTEQDQRNL